MNTRYIRMIKNLRAFLMKKLPGFVKAMKLVMQKAKEAIKKLFSLKKVLRLKLQEAEGDDNKGFINIIAKKLKVIIIGLVKPIFGGIYAMAKKLVQKITAHTESPIKHGLLLLSFLTLVNTFLIILVAEFIYRREERNKNSKEELTSQEIMDKSFSFVSIFIGPVLEEIARRISINATDKKSLGYTLVVMIYEGVGGVSSVLKRGKLVGAPKKNIAKIASIIVVSRAMHLVFHKLQLSSKYGIVLSVIFHSAFNYFVEFLEPYFNSQINGPKTPE